MTKDNIPIEHDLIFDVGMHQGEDTRFYLSEGFRVLAIEANPELVASARLLFEPAIKAGRLTFLNVGLSDRESVEKFWVCDGNTAWSSFNREIASRDGCAHHSVEIPTRRLDSILREFGIPIYLKMDIEGKELDGLEAMKGLPLPRFISVEDVGPDPITGRIRILEMLHCLGYRYFNLVAQTNFRPLFRRWQTHYKMNLLDRLVESLACGRLSMPVIRGVAERFSYKSELLRRNNGRDYPFGSSGPWGQGIPGPWVTYDKARLLYSRIRTNFLSNPKLDPRMLWCDWHATVEAPIGRSTHPIGTTRDARLEAGTDSTGSDRNTTLTYNGACGMGGAQQAKKIC
jgi:FkbM family methyltransferase